MTLFQNQQPFENPGSAGGFSEKTDRMQPIPNSDRLTQQIANYPKNQNIPPMKRIKNFLLALTLLLSIGISGMAAPVAGGGGDPITDWVEGTVPNQVSIQKIEKGPFRMGENFFAEVHLTQPHMANLTLTNLNGDIIWGSSVVMDDGINLLKFKLSNLSSGVYFLTIDANGARDTQTISVK